MRSSPARTASVSESSSLCLAQGEAPGRARLQVGRGSVRAEAEWDGRPARLFSFIRYGRDARATRRSPRPTVILHRAVSGKGWSLCLRHCRLKFESPIRRACARIRRAPSIHIESREIPSLARSARLPQGHRCKSCSPASPQIV